MKREGDSIKHPPPTLYNVESFSFVNKFLLAYSLCHTPCVSTLSHTHTYTRTFFLLRCTESITILYTKHENLFTTCVPIICWPHIAEQRLNARILVYEWRVGLDLTMEYDSLVKVVNIQQAVRESIQGDIGREITKRTLGLKEVVAQSVQEAESSQCYLRSLVQDLKRTYDDMLKS